MHGEKDVGIMLSERMTKDECALERASAVERRVPSSALALARAFHVLMAFRRHRQFP